MKNIYWILLAGSIGCQKKAAIAHLQELNVVCPMSAASSYYYPEVDIDLVQMDAKPYFSNPTVLWVGPTEASIDWEYIKNDRYFLPTLTMVNERYKDTPNASGIQIAFDASVSTERIITVLEWTRSVGYSNIWLVTQSTQGPVLPEPPIPQSYEKLRNLQYTHPPAERESIMGQKIAKDIGLCKPAREAFDAVVSAHPEQQCYMLLVGLEYSIERCPMMNASKLASDIHALVEPMMYPIVHSIQLDHSAPSITLPAEQTWKQVAPLMFSQQEPFWIEGLSKPEEPLPSPEPEPEDIPSDN